MQEPDVVDIKVVCGDPWLSALLTDTDIQSAVSFVRATVEEPAMHRYSELVLRRKHWSTSTSMGMGMDMAMNAKSKTDLDINNKNSSFARMTCITLKCIASLPLPAAQTELLELHIDFFRNNMTFAHPLLRGYIVRFRPQFHDVSSSGSGSDTGGRAAGGVDVDDVPASASGSQRWLYRITRKLVERVQRRAWDRQPQRMKAEIAV